MIGSPMGLVPVQFVFNTQQCTLKIYNDVMNRTQPGAPCDVILRSPLVACWSVLTLGARLWVGCGLLCCSLC